jgi:hypothetical protein
MDNFTSEIIHYQLSIIHYPLSIVHYQLISNFKIKTFLS